MGRTPGERLGHAVARVTVWSTRHAKAVLLLYVVVTLVFAAGLGDIRVRSTDYDLMPESHPSALANERTLREIPGYRSADTMWIEVAHPELGENITSEAAIRGADEAIRFIQERVPEFTHTASLAYLIKLVNYTASGVADPVPNATLPAQPLPGTPATQELVRRVGEATGTSRLLPNGSAAPPLPLPRTSVPPDPAAFALPADSETFQRDLRILQAGAMDAIAAQTNEAFTGAILVFLVDINITQQGPEAVLPVGEKFTHAAEAWRDEGCAKTKARSPAVPEQPVFRCEHTYILGQSISGHMTELARNDFALWGPIVFVVTFLVLAFAFRDAVSILIAFASFCLGLVWTYGLMGWLHIPLTFFGLLLVPITMGVGKEYAIYVTNQFLEYDAAGLGRREAWSLVGRRAGGALFVATATSVAGMAAMFQADFQVMKDLALLTLFAFCALFLLSITFIPAAQSLRRKRAHGREFRPSRLMGALAEGVARHRVLTVVAVVAVSGVLYVESLEIKEYFGISGGFREGDFLQESYQWYNEQLGGSGTELVVIEGDIAQWETLQYLHRLDDAFINDTELIRKPSNVGSLMLGLRTYYNLRDGMVNPDLLATSAGDLDANVPRDAAAVRRDIAYMYNSSIWNPLVSIFVSPDADVTVTHIFYHIATEDYAGLKHDWEKLNADLDSVPPPDTVRETNLVGTQDTFYLFVEFGLPWLDYVSYAATFATLAIAILVLGRLRDLFSLLPGGAAAALLLAGPLPAGVTLHEVALVAGVLTFGILLALRARDLLAITVPMAVAAIWWAGLLPVFGIERSMTLMLPVVLLITDGSDYAIQYVWNQREIGSMKEVYRTTGKANLYVVLATVIAFLLFVPMQLVLSSQGALAAALAILSFFAATTLLVPLFYPEAAGVRSTVSVVATRDAPAAQHVPVAVVRAAEPE